MNALSIKTNDIFDELRDENILMKKRLELSEKCVKILFKIKTLYEKRFNECQQCCESREKMSTINDSLNTFELQLQSLLVTTTPVRNSSSDVTRDATNRRGGGGGPIVVRVRRPPRASSRRKRVFVCTHANCTYSTHARQQFVDHENCHTDQKPYECVECHKRFAALSTLQSHVRYVHSTRPLTCSWLGCEFQTKFKHRLNVHQWTHLGERPHACDWPGCDFTTAYTNKLKFHRFRHTGEKPYTCSWPECGQRFRERGHLKTHMLKHTGQKPWPCGECAHRFQTKQAMRCHVQRRHHTTTTTT